MPPLQGLMTHSKDSPHPPISICGDFNSPKIGSPRCHVCTNYPNSFQHLPQNSVWPQPPLRFAEDPLKAALWSSSNIKYLLYEVKQPEWESLTLNVVRIKVWDVPLSLPNCPTLMLKRASASAQPPSPSSFRLTVPPPPLTTSLDLDGMVMSFSFLLWQTWTLGNFRASIWGQRDVAVNGCRDKDGTGDNKPAPDDQTGQLERCCPCATSLHDSSGIGSIYSIFQVIVHELSFFFLYFSPPPSCLVLWFVITPNLWTVIPNAT